MQFSSLFLAFIAATVTLAVPIESSDPQAAREVLNVLEARAAGAGTIQDTTCTGAEAADTTKWTSAEIKSSYNAGKGNVDKKTGAITAGSTVKIYGNNAVAVLPAMPSACKGASKLYEYRLKANPTDRVIWGWNKPAKSAENGASFFCLVVTHRGKALNDFKPCTAT